MTLALSLTAKPLTYTLRDIHLNFSESVYHLGILDKSNVGLMEITNEY